MKGLLAIDNLTLLDEISLILSQGKKVKLRAKGTSMRPFIHGDEDLLLLAPVTVLHKGDVVLARIEGGRYVIHRVTGVRDDRITLMGDGNLYATEVCTRSDIYGKVEGIIRKGKERNLGSAAGRFLGMAWMTLLPLRRLVFRSFKIPRLRKRFKLL